MKTNEYLLTPYVKGEAVADAIYIHCRTDAAAIKNANLLLGSWKPSCDEVDMQVIRDYKDEESELADEWWSIKRDGVIFHA